MTGYIKLWRVSMDSRIFQNDSLWKVWCWCLLRASHKKRWVPVKTGRGETEIEIMPGQFIFGRKKAAKFLKIKPTTVYDKMKKLENFSAIALKPVTHYTIVSVINWDRYQNQPGETRQPTVNQPSTNRQPTDTNKNVKNVKNVENIYKPADAPKNKNTGSGKELSVIPENDGNVLERFVTDFILYIKNTWPKFSPSSDRLLPNSIDVVEKLIALDGFSLEYVIKVVKWAVNDDFWSSNMISLASVRRKKNKTGRTKFQKIAAAYESENRPAALGGSKINRANRAAGAQAVARMKMRAENESRK